MILKLHLCRTPLKIKLHRFEKLLVTLKWLYFMACISLCVWKIADSFVTFGEKEVGTKIELKYNHETALPGFAVCRHPNQILSKHSREGAALEADLGLNISDIRYLTAFESAEKMGADLLQVFRKFAFADADSVTSVVLSSRGQYAGTSTPSLTSRDRFYEHSFRPNTFRRNLYLQILNKFLSESIRYGQKTLIVLIVRYF
jgi:hypothetical protein